MIATLPTGGCRATEIDHTYGTRLRLRGHTVPPAERSDARRRWLVLKDRSGGVERRVPLPDDPWSPETTRFEVHLSLASQKLALHEAIWDLYVETEPVRGSPYRQRIRGDLVRHGGREFTSIEPYLDHRYRPYITVRGGLSVKVAGLCGHVEVGEVWVRETQLDVSGAVVGVPLRSRLDPEVCVPLPGGLDQERPSGVLASVQAGCPARTGGSVVVRRRADGAVLELPTTWSGERLAASVDLTALAGLDRTAAERSGGARPSQWELLLATPAQADARPGQAEAVADRRRAHRTDCGAGRGEARWWLRLARYLDDIHPKDKILRFPQRQVYSSGEGWLIRPRFTRYDTLAIESLPAVEPGQPQARGTATEPSRAAA